MSRTGIGTVGLGSAPVSKADRAYQAILEGIRDQRHEPGDRLVLSQIAAELGMSVVPVREAIRRLAVDPHAPMEFRCNTVAGHLDEFHEAFDVREGAGMYRAPEERVSIW